MLDSVEVLELGANPLGADAGVALGRSPRLASLRRLGLKGCGLGEGIRGLAASTGLRRLRDLDLSGNGITAAGIEALVASPLLRDVPSVHLDCNRLGDDGMLVELPEGSAEVRVGRIE